MNNLIITLMMILVLGAGFLLGSKHALSDGQVNVLELINNTSDNSNSQEYIKWDLNESKGQYQTVNNQKYHFQEESNSKTENDKVINNSINEVSNNEQDTNLNDGNGQEMENDQSENKKKQ